MYPFNFTQSSWIAILIYFGTSIFVMAFSAIDVIVGERRDKEEAARAARESGAE